MHNYGVFTVGIALIRIMSSTSDNAIVSANAISNYSYVNARNSDYTDVQIARCVTGLGPNGTDDNTALGGCYFNGTRMPFVGCNDNASAIIQPRVSGEWAGVINIVECRDFTTDVEGVYTCMLLNSLMIHESIKFGVYFSGRCELVDKHMHSITQLSFFSL